MDGQLSSSAQFPDAAGGAGGLPFSGGTLTGSLTMTGGTLTVRSDADVTTILGKTKLSSAAAADWATFSHFDFASATEFALAQNGATGAVILNKAVGVALTLASGGSGKWGLTAASDNWQPLNGGQHVGDLAASNFVRDIYTDGKIMFSEIAAPAVAGTNMAYLYIDGNGVGGKSRLMVIFQSGAGVPVALEV